MLFARPSTRSPCTGFDVAQACPASNLAILAPGTPRRPPLPSCKKRQMPISRVQELNLPQLSDDLCLALRPQLLECLQFKFVKREVILGETAASWEEFIEVKRW